MEKETEVILKFPEVDYLNPPVLTMDEVAFRYPNTDRTIFSNVNLGANAESRICIVGENGAGKTTLLKIIMGVNAPTSGIIHHHRGLKFGYFSQHHVDQLEMNVSCVELLQREFPGKTVEEYRRQLGSFGVGGEMALQIVGSLSGGQKSRVAFAKMCMGKQVKLKVELKLKVIFSKLPPISLFLTNRRIIWILSRSKLWAKLLESSLVELFWFLTTSV